MGHGRRSRSVATALLAVALGLAACSDAESGSDGDVDRTEVAAAAAGPEVAPGEGEPPEVPVRTELVEGAGAEVEQGAVLTLHYKGVTWSGSEFANSWERGEPLTYTHGEGRWIEGWVEGLDGLRVGGERRIEVPAELAYGDRGAPGIAPGEAVVFVVELLSVESGS